MAKIVCEKCGTEYKFEVAKDFDCCPVCKAPLIGDDGVSSYYNNETGSAEDEHPDWITWYYYGFKSDNGKTTSLRDKPIDLFEFGDTYFLIQEFKAPPRDEAGSSEKAKEVLRTYIPDAFVYKKEETPQIMCPRCFSTSFQFVPRKYSLLTGFATRKIDRMCNKCGKRF